MASSTTFVEYKTVPIGGAKNGGTRKVAVHKPAVKAVRKTANPSKLRPSLVPGTVLILLAGRFRGKRVILLKQLDSGLLLVTGPHKVNGVPLRRISQSYVIATSVKVDLAGVKLSEKLGDKLFERSKENEKTLTSEMKALQKEVDAAVLPKIKAVKQLTGYLKTSFSLKRGQAPHDMKF